MLHAMTGMNVVAALGLILLSFVLSSVADNITTVKHTEAIIAARKDCQNRYPHQDRICFIRDEHTILKSDEELRDSQQQAVQSALKSFRYANSSENDIYVYVHAHINSSASPAGVVVLDKILDRMRAYGLMRAATMIYICLYGSNALSEDIVKTYGNYNKIYLLHDMSKFSTYYEFPTLLVMYYHTKQYHPSSKILYLHTKGITNPARESRSFWRDMMLLWNVEFWAYSVQQLSKGWDTTGVRFHDSPWPHYSGNFFWVRADFLTKAIPPENLLWYWRYGAERWLLADRSKLSRNCKAEYTNKSYPFPLAVESIDKIFQLDNCSR